MKYINDPIRLERLMEEKNILSHFESRGMDFRLVIYQKGEFLSSPENPLKDLLFVVNGRMKIYGLREDGSVLSVSMTDDEDAFLGDMEFVGRDYPALYSEAVEEVICVALPIEDNRGVLEKDSVFLMYLLRSMAQKILTFTMFRHSSQSLEDKVMIYLRDIQPDHTLHGINTGMMQLHCSRRQLQRVVKKLCEDEKLKKIGKGKYKLTSK